MKRLLLPFVLAFIACHVLAQDYPQVSYSNSYSEQAFYRLSDNATTNIANSSWDIALSTFGEGIFINETAVVFGAENALYLAPTNNFDDVVNPDDLSGRLLNDEKSWDFGAFNEPRDENNADDYGWGLYDPMSDMIVGNRVFVVRFKNSTYQKMQFSQAQGIYTIIHADLDGSNETTLTVNKADFPDNHFAYLSLVTGQTLTNVPSEWDLLFTRYSSPVDDGAGGFFDLVTSGVLSAPGIEVAEARGISPETVEYSDYIDSLSSDIDVIGYDWKVFDNVSWSLPTDLAYFVKNTLGQVWKIVFLTFDGSSTGKVVFEKTEIIASPVQEQSAFENFAVFPNPLTETSAAVFSIQEPGRVRVNLSNVLGQTVWSDSYDATLGLNAFQLPPLAVSSGTYFLSLQIGGETVTKKIYK